MHVHTLVPRLPSAANHQICLAAHQTELLQTRALFELSTGPCSNLMCSPQNLFIGRKQGREVHVSTTLVKGTTEKLVFFFCICSLRAWHGGRNSLSWYHHQTCWIMKTQPKGVVSWDVSLDSEAAYKFPPYLLISAILFTAQPHKELYWGNRKNGKAWCRGKKLASLLKPNLVKLHPKYLLWKEQPAQ